MVKLLLSSARCFAARGKPFYAESYLEKYEQFDWMKGLLKDRPSQPWTFLIAGETK